MNERNGRRRGKGGGVKRGEWEDGSGARRRGEREEVEEDKLRLTTAEGYPT